MAFLVMKEMIETSCQLFFSIIPLFFKVTVLISGGFLVLLVLRHQVIHVGLSLCELHLIHTLTGVPMEESLAPEHSCELLRDALEQLLDGCAVTNEGGRLLRPRGGMSQTAVLTLLGIHSTK